MTRFVPGWLSRRRLQLWFCLTVAQLVLLALVVATAFAHASLLSADPAPGALVPPTLREIRLSFDQALGPASTLFIFTEDFQIVAGIAPQVEGDGLRARLSTPLEARIYTVQWKAVSADGDIVDGSYQFGVSNSPVVWLRSWFPVEGVIGVSSVLALGGFWWLYRHTARPTQRRPSKPKPSKE